MSKEFIDLGLTRRIAQFIVTTDMNSIPRDAYENCKVVFLDWLGCAMIGVDNPLVIKLMRYAEMMGGNEQASILGHGVKKNVTQAAIINGAASHVTDYDDTTTIDIRHASVGLFPSVLALSEWKGKSGAEFLAAYIIGYKVAALIGSCVGMSQYNAGLHTTSTMGHFASAAGCARLLGLNEQQTTYALSLAGTLSSGLKVVFGTMTKALHAGNAAQAGLRAALLAEDNYTCAEDLLEGTDGYLQVFGGHIDQPALDSLGKTWDFDRLAQKYHASCHFTHSAIESVLYLVNKEQLLPDDVKSITVHSTQLALNAAGKTDPKTALEGKFSIHYCLANAIIRGDTGLKGFTDEKVNDPGIREFMKKISLKLGEDLQPMEARVTLKTKGGKIYEKSSDVFREIPGLEEKRRRIKNKFMDICQPVWGEQKAEFVMDKVMSLEREEDMKDFVDQIAALPD
ncbi:MAG: MmgE/PrpD family protein [Deltaproteobacteria bacterium]|nr:MmgE/PrpD family protein [Deltaproteobacteria bacterium]